MTFSIMLADEKEYSEVRSFYHTLIDQMETAQYKPAWEKEVYPSDDYLKDALQKQTLYVGRWAGELVSAMIVNQESNEGYRQGKWQTEADAKDITLIHALGVMPTYTRRGLAAQMVKKAIELARWNRQKVIRLDVLAGNLPAERLYAGLGFTYIGTVSMFYVDTGWTDFRLYEYPL